MKISLNAVSWQVKLSRFRVDDSEEKIASIATFNSETQDILLSEEAYNKAKVVICRIADCYDKNDKIQFL